MDFELLPAQKEFFLIPESNTSNRDIALYMGGYGSGKTFCGALMGICLALKYVGIRGLVGAQTYTLVRDTTLKQYIEHLDSMGFIDGVHYEYKKAVQCTAFYLLTIRKRRKSQMVYTVFEVVSVVVLQLWVFLPEE